MQIVWKISQIYLFCFFFFRWMFNETLELYFRLIQSINHTFSISLFQAFYLTIFSICPIFSFSLSLQLTLDVSNLQQKILSLPFIIWKREKKLNKSKPKKGTIHIHISHDNLKIFKNNKIFILFLRCIIHAQSHSYLHTITTTKKKLTYI